MVNVVKPSTKRFVILISGRGSNMRTIVETCKTNPQVEIAAVIAHTADSQGLQWAQMQGIPTASVLHKDFANRTAFEQSLTQVINQFSPDFIILAGFMRILTPDFVSQYENRLVNIHPSLLPVFPGLHTHQQALDEGVCVHGCTVHFVTAELDHGPIIAQAAVPVVHGDTADTLSARVLKQEHIIYPAVVNYLAQGVLSVNGHKVVFNQAVKRLFLADENLG